MFLTDDKLKLQEYLKQNLNKHYVYLLIDPETNFPFYVGKGKNFRCLQHEKDALNPQYPHRSVHRKIQSIINKQQIIKYNIYCFYETEQQAFETEKRLIEQYGRKDINQGTLCNLTEGGDCGPSQLGKKRTQQTIQKIIIDRQKRREQGLIHSIQTRNIISKKLKNRSRNKQTTEQIKQKISIPVCQVDKNGTIINCFENATQAALHIGLKTPNLIRKSYEQQIPLKGFMWIKGVCLLNQLHPYKRKIVQYSLQGDKIAEYLTGEQAAKQLNCSASGIYNCCRGLTKTYLGFIWKYEQLQSAKTRKTSKKIAKCDLNGNVIQIYNNVFQAAQQNNISSVSLIYQCCYQQIKQSHGYIWKFT